MSYRITKYSPEDNGEVFVSTNGVDYTCHLDKAQEYKSFDDALFAHRQWFPECTIQPFDNPILYSSGERVPVIGSLIRKDDES